MVYCFLWNIQVSHFVIKGFNNIYQSRLYKDLFVPPPILSIHPPPIVFNGSCRCRIAARDAPGIFLNLRISMWSLLFSKDFYKMEWINCNLTLLFVLAMDHCLLERFLNIWSQILFEGDLHMLLFRNSLQLSVEPLIAHVVCNSQHAWAITSIHLLNCRAYLTGLFW